MLDNYVTRPDNTVIAGVRNLDAAGSLTGMPRYPYPNASYSGSKPLANIMVVKMGIENDWLITLCIYSGTVQTNMGNLAARAFGLEKAPRTLEEISSNTAHII